jgi:uncharacterized protein YbaA (DUF1428 family)
MQYVDGYVVPVPKKNIAAYKRMPSWAPRCGRGTARSSTASGVGDDLQPKGMVGFPKVFKPKAGETVFFSYVVFKSLARHRDAVNKKGHEGSRPRRDDGPEDALRLQAHGLRRLQGARGELRPA